MDYINSNPQYNMKVMYSTPSLYVDSIHAKNLTWTVNTQDFFPYASGLKVLVNFLHQGPHYYWSGYYTSRPGIKGYVRSRANLLHAANKLLTEVSSEISVNISYHSELIKSLWEAQAILQHHGT